MKGTSWLESGRGPTEALYVQGPASCAHCVHPTARVTPPRPGAGVGAVQRPEPRGLASGGVRGHPPAPGEAEEPGGDPERPRRGTHAAAAASERGAGSTPRPGPQVCVNIVSVCVCVYVGLDVSGASLTLFSSLFFPSAFTITYIILFVYFLIKRYLPRVHGKILVLTDAKWTPVAAVVVMRSGISLWILGHTSHTFKIYWRLYVFLR